MDVHTDSERAVGELIGNSTGRQTFSIRRAFPQQHRSVGGAERTVRELKESLSVFEGGSDAQGLDIFFTYETLVDVLMYLVLCNNHFSTSRGSDRSPLEMVAGRKLTKPTSCYRKWLTAQMHLLLDSGASTSVLAESNLAAFRSVLQNSEKLGGYRAQWVISRDGRSAEIGVQMHMSSPSSDDWCWKKVRLNILVGSIKHNILSITLLADSGWRFVQGPKGFDLFHEDLGLHCLEVAHFASCPWVRLHPDTCQSSAYRSESRTTKNDQRPETKGQETVTGTQKKTN